MQQSEYLSVFFVCKKPVIIDEEEFRNGNNGHYSAPSDDDRPVPTPEDEASDELEK